jgi:hypothetical protein
MGWDAFEFDKDVLLRLPASVYTRWMISCQDEEDIIRYTSLHPRNLLRAIYRTTYRGGL